MTNGGYLVGVCGFATYSAWSMAQNFLHTRQRPEFKVGKILAAADAAVPRIMLDDEECLYAVLPFLAYSLVAEHL